MITGGLHTCSYIIGRLSVGDACVEGFCTLTVVEIVHVTMNGE
jgi:hypothetical protein